MKLNLKTLRVTTLLVTGLTLGGNALADIRVIDEPNFKAVGNVSWNKQVDLDYEKVINRNIPDNMVSLVFIRRQDNDLQETSANISVNDRFHVSLQPNGYTQVYSCAGANLIAAEKTGLKTNDLLQNAKTFNLAENNTYYFYVDISDDGNESKISKLTELSAKKILKNKKYQAHQISRVVTNCPQIREIENTEPVKDAPAMLEKTVNIELEVLFDTDKHFIKPAFHKEVQEVAEFMTAYPNTTAVIEGHTDSRAPEDYNQKLSERRANSVKQMLVDRFGIKPSRLEAIGYGELRPRSTNNTKEGRQLNRRVIAVINEKVKVDKNGKQIIE